MLERCLVVCVLDVFVVVGFGLHFDVAVCPGRLVAGVVWIGEGGNLTWEPSGPPCVSSERDVEELFGGKRGAVVIPLPCTPVVSCWGETRQGAVAKSRTLCPSSVVLEGVVFSDPEGDDMIEC